jgi:alpha-beta hydrolase superfamily lysophospholipase
MYKPIFVTFMFLCVCVSGMAQLRTFSIPTSDGISVFADQYFVDSPPQHPVILLCHQAGYSRGEYKPIAPRLNQYNMNAIAIDQRSGRSVLQVPNRTVEMAIAAKLPTGYLDAEQDIITAIEYIANTYHQQVILWGSSYSASLALKIAGENKHVKGVVAFSPGEYFGDKLKLKAVIQKMPVPAWVTSSKSESKDLTTLVKGIKNVQQYIPQGDGIHGSSVLNPSLDDSREYWRAVHKFLLELQLK